MRSTEVVGLMADDSGRAARVEGPGGRGAVRRRLLTLAEDEAAVDAEDVLRQAEEADAMDPQSRYRKERQ
jgi:hypothetical protein